MHLCMHAANTLNSFAGDDLISIFSRQILYYQGPEWHQRFYSPFLCIAVCWTAISCFYPPSFFFFFFSFCERCPYLLHTVASAHMFSTQFVHAVDPHRGQAQVATGHL